MKIPRKSKTRRLSAVGGVELILSLTTGCTTTEQQANPQMTPHQGRDAVIQLVVDTTEQQEAKNWEASTGTATVQSYTMNNGDQGAAYQFALMGRSTRQTLIQMLLVRPTASPL